MKIDRYQPLFEKFLDADEITPMYGNKNEYIEVFINPSQRELNQCLPGAKGIIDNKGNVYVLCSKSTNFLHADLINFLIDNKYIKSSKLNDIEYLDKHNKKFIGIERMGRNTFQLSSSYTPNFSEKNMDLLEAYYDLAKDKNSGIDFLY